MNHNDVDIGKAVISKARDTINVRALGSCIALMLWDTHRKIGGVAHILLPDSTLASSRNGNKPYQYADTAVTALLNELIQQGAVKANIKAKAVGGANMFPNGKETEKKPIGQQNMQSIRNALERERITLIAEDTGGIKGRTAHFNLDSGSVLVSMDKGDKRNI